MNVIAGLDLGQLGDYTALATVERREAGGRPLPYGVTGLRRWELGTTYTRIADDVARLFAGPLQGAALVVDNTGVGVPVLELIRSRQPKVGHLLAVTITAGQAVRQADGWTWHVAKVHLVSTLQTLMQSGRVAVAPGLREWPQLEEELRSYRMKVTAAGNETFNAREGAHDDLLLALALACWYGEAFPAWGPGDISSGDSGFRAELEAALGPTPDLDNVEW